LEKGSWSTAAASSLGNLPDHESSSLHAVPMQDLRMRWLRSPDATSSQKEQRASSLSKKRKWRPESLIWWARRPSLVAFICSFALLQTCVFETPYHDTAVICLWCWSIALDSLILGSCSYSLAHFSPMGCCRHCSAALLAQYLSLFRLHYLPVQISRTILRPAEQFL
jgi:hypothetical protein